jgi:hypothetical protein
MGTVTEKSPVLSTATKGLLYCPFCNLTDPDLTGVYCVVNLPENVKVSSTIDKVIPLSRYVV